MRTEIYAANLTEQTIATAGTTINFGSTIRRVGKCFSISNGNIEMNGLGFCDVLANVTITSGTTGGTAVLTLYKDGIAIPGATASQTLAASSSASLCVPAVIRKFCNCSTSEITATITGIDGTISNATIKVEKN